MNIRLSKQQTIQPALMRIPSFSFSEQSVPELDLTNRCLLANALIKIVTLLCVPNSKYYITVLSNLYDVSILKKHVKRAPKMVCHTPDFTFCCTSMTVKIVISLTAVKVKIWKTTYKEISRNSDSISGYIAEENKNIDSKWYKHPSVHRLLWWLRW